MESPEHQTLALSGTADLRKAAARGDTSSVETKLGLVGGERRAGEAIGALEVAVANRRWDTASYLADFLRDTSGGSESRNSWPGITGRPAESDSRREKVQPPRANSAPGRTSAPHVLELSAPDFRTLADRDPALAAEVAANYMDPAAHPGRAGYVHLILLVGLGDASGEFVGHAGLSPKSSGYLPGRLASRVPGGALWLEDLFVRCDRRRAGHGRRLVEAALAAAGASPVALGVRGDASEARSLYDAQGFEPVASAGRWTVMARPAPTRAAERAPQFGSAPAQSREAGAVRRTGSGGDLSSFVVRCSPRALPPA